MRGLGFLFGSAEGRDTYYVLLLIVSGTEKREYTLISIELGLLYMYVHSVLVDSRCIR